MRNTSATTFGTAALSSSSESAFTTFQTCGSAPNGAFEAIVDRTMFDAAQAIIHARSLRLSDEEMLMALQALLQDRGYLSGIVIDESENLPSSIPD